MGRKKKSKKKIALKILLLILLALIIFAGIMTYKAVKLGGGIQGFVAVTMGHDENTIKNIPKITCLLVGKSQNLTDTIIVASYNPQTQEAVMMSIPRDTFTGKDKSKATAMNKINVLYQQSPQKLLKAVNDITGLDIKNYITIDTKALRELVDAIGGVYFDVPIDMDYDDSSQELYIHLKKGYQLLDGNKAEQLVRFRKNNNFTGYSAEYGSDDYGRMRTQREFIIAALKQTVQAKNILKIGEILDIANRNVETNMEIAKLKDYLPYIINMNADNIETAALPGISEKPAEVWVFIHNKKQTQKLIGELFLGLPTDEEKEENSKINIELLYLENKKEIADKIEKDLETQGYKVTKSKVESAPKTMIINRKKMTEDQTQKISNIILNNLVQNGEDNNEFNYTIILGKDYTNN
ncbi:MAG: LCP family protein [Clostridia bacterium]|nr:LCP family protein [Clostridia bacterium]